MIMLFPRYQYNDYYKFKDASVFLQTILTNDVIQIIHSYMRPNEDTALFSLHYLNVEKRWRQLECLSYQQLNNLYSKIPSDKRIILYSTQNYTNTGLSLAQIICNKKLMIETISRYERVNIVYHPLKRTSSCSDLQNNDSFSLVQQFRKIWKSNHQELSNIYLKMNVSNRCKPALYYWPDDTKHLDEKNADIIRSHLITSLFKNVKINKTIVQELLHTV